MLQIDRVTADPFQTQALVLDDGTTINLTMRFRPMQFGWFIEELAYGAFILRGVRIVNSPNMLHQFINKIPFGLACYSVDNREPSLIEDFASGASRLFILTQIETRQYLEFLKFG